MSSSLSQSLRRALPALLLSVTPLAAAAEPAAVGQVVSVSGTAYAETPGGARRALACGDTVRVGDLITTGEDGRVGVLASDVYAQIDSSSSARFDLAADREPDVALQKGRARLFGSATDAAARHHLETPQASSSTSSAGGDTEAYVLSEKAGAYSMLCEWGKPLDVKRIGKPDTLLAGPGQCAIAKPREPLYLAKAHAQRIPLAGEAACPTGELIGKAADRFNLADVSAPPPPGGGIRPPAIDTGRPDQPCQVAACLGGRGLRVVESPAGNGGIPGVGNGGIPGVPGPARP
jgi:hypothetical protein